jgi:hydrogenase expression/formation protein HypC
VHEPAIFSPSAWGGWEGLPLGLNGPAKLAEVTAFPYNMQSIRESGERQMCLAIPAKVIEVDESNQGRIDYLGTKVKSNFALLEGVKVGDWVIVHAGYAISKLDEEEAQETLSLIREYMQFEQND